MKRSQMGAIGAIVGVLAIGGGITAIASGSSSHSTKAQAAKAAKVSLRKTSLGKILVGPSGKTLYLFEKDKTKKSKCNGECANDWPPLITKGKPSAGAGVKGHKLGTSTRSNGSKQVTYNGHPLYYFEDDHKKGQTHGEGVNAFGAKWFVMNASGKKVTASDSSSPTSGSGY